MIEPSQNPDQENAFSRELILKYIDSFMAGAGVKRAEIDIERFEAAVRELHMSDFPSHHQNRSPFKTAAAWITSFVSNAPIRTPLPRAAVGDLADIPNHQNIILALAIALDSLHGAKIGEGNRAVALEQPLAISRHFYNDMVEALSMASDPRSYRMIALLLESIAYQANPAAEKPKMREQGAAEQPATAGDSN